MCLGNTEVTSKDCQLKVHHNNKHHSDMHFIVEQLFIWISGQLKLVSKRFPWWLTRKWLFSIFHNLYLLKYQFICLYHNLKNKLWTMLALPFTESPYNLQQNSFPFLLHCKSWSENRKSSIPGIKPFCQSLFVDYGYWLSTPYSFAFDCIKCALWLQIKKTFYNFFCSWLWISCIWSWETENPAFSGKYII